MKTLSRKFPLIFIFCIPITFAIQADKLSSPEDLRDTFLDLHSKGHLDAARSLFCEGDTAKKIVDMYNRSLESAFRLKISSAMIQAIPNDRQPTVPHILIPEKRLFITFSEEDQQGYKIASKYFFIGKLNGHYCLTIPKI